MRSLFLMLLLLSLPAMAENASQPVQGKEAVTQTQKEKVVEPKNKQLCDPKQTIQMPKTFN